RQLPRRLLVRVPRRPDVDPRRGLHAVDGEARDLRRGRQRERRGAHRRERPRVRGARRARARGAGARPVAGGAAGGDAAGRRERGAADHGIETMSSWTELGGQVAAAEIFVLAAACVILVVDVFLTERSRWITYALSLLTLAGAAYMTVRYGVQGRVPAFDGMYIADPMGDVLKLFSYGTVAVSFLYSREYLQRRGLFKGEYFILSLIALLGVMVMISAGNLLTVYLGVELLSLSLYAMVAFDRESGIAA